MDQRDGAPMALAYTSGTTGTPKGVTLLHSTVHAMLTGLSLGYGWTSEECFFITAPLAFAGGFICNLAACFFLGASGHIEKRFDPERALAAFSREGCHSFWRRSYFLAANFRVLRFRQHRYIGAKARIYRWRTGTRCSAGSLPKERCRHSPVLRLHRVLWRRDIAGCGGRAKTASSVAVVL